MATSDAATIRNHAALIWSVADLLRGDYKPSEYGRVILPLTVIRRLDCVLEPTKAQVVARHGELKGRLENLDPVLEGVAGEQFYNVSPLTLTKVLDDPANVADNLRAYIAGFSESARDVIEKFGFDVQIERLDKADLLFLTLSKFCEVDLHPDTVSNLEMGYLYEELIRRFSELSNETAGEHFTPREVIRLMVDLLFVEDDDLLAKPGIKKSLFDPACGTGGMLSEAEEHLRKLNPDARLEVFGQELNPETYAVCRSDMMIKGQDASHIVLGNSFSEDGHAQQAFDYMLANPPFGVEWKKVQGPVRQEYETKGFSGRFGAGLPRINDGSLLFLQHMIAKMKTPEQGGSRIAIVFNGSPLFTGGAGSGESEIRRWIIENDWLEAVVALPDQLFYNTGISTYLWIITNRKSDERRGKVQLIDARAFSEKMRKSLGDKRKIISDSDVADITRLYGEFSEGAHVKIFPNGAFGFMRITVERPLRLRWEISVSTLRGIESGSKVPRMNNELRSDLIAALGKHIGWSAVTRSEAVKYVNAVLKPMSLGAAERKAILGALAVRDADAPTMTDAKGNLEPDPELRDNENVPLPDAPLRFEADMTERLGTVEYRTAVSDYLAAEVLPYAPDVWVDHGKTKIGYEVPFTRHFYRYTPPRPLEQIDAEIKLLEAKIQRMLDEVSA